MEELEIKIKALEDIINRLEEQNEQIIGQAYTFYLHINSLTKQLIEKEVIDKTKLAEDMDELNELNAKLHKFSEPEPTAPETLAT